MKFSAVFLKTGKWYSAFIPKILGVNTQGRTLSAAKKNLKDAVREYFTANKSIVLKDIPRGKRIVEENFVVE